MAKEIFKNLYHRMVTLNDDASFSVICHTCQQVIYEAEVDNYITQSVASGVVSSHTLAFSQPHHVSVIDSGLKEILWTKNNPNGTGTLLVSSTQEEKC